MPGNLFSANLPSKQLIFYTRFLFICFNMFDIIDTYCDWSQDWKNSSRWINSSLTNQLEFDPIVTWPVEKNKTNSMLFPLFFSWIISILETFQELSNVRLTFFDKIYPFRGKLTLKNILFQDLKLRMFVRHFEHEKGEGVKVNDTIPTFCATLFPEKVLRPKLSVKSLKLWHFVC